MFLHSWWFFWLMIASAVIAVIVVSQKQLLGEAFRVLWERALDFKVGLVRRASNHRFTRPLVLGRGRGVKRFILFFLPVGLYFLFFSIILLLMFLIGTPLVDWPLLLVGKIREAIKEWKENRMVIERPVVVYNEVNGIRVCASLKAYKAAKKEHAFRVMNGIIRESDPFPVFRALIFADKKGRERLRRRSDPEVVNKAVMALSGWFSDAVELMEGCTVWRRDDIFIPFCTKNKKKWIEEVKLFRGSALNKIEARSFLTGLDGNELMIFNKRLRLQETS